MLCDITYQIITDNSRIKDTNERKREFRTVVIIVGNKEIGKGEGNEEGRGNLPLTPTLLHTFPKCPTTYHTCFAIYPTKHISKNITALVYTIVEVVKQYITIHTIDCTATYNAAIIIMIIRKCANLVSMIYNVFRVNNLKRTLIS